MPNTYHVVVDWFCLLEETIQIINDIINGKLNEKLVDVFRLPFCAFPVNGESHNCRSLLVHIIKDSLSRDGYLKLNQYMIGNAHIHDIQNGCMTFRVKNREVIKGPCHPCGWFMPLSCCKTVIKNPDEKLCRVFVKDMVENE